MDTTQQMAGADVDSVAEAGSGPRAASITAMHELASSIERDASAAASTAQAYAGAQDAPTPPPPTKEWCRMCPAVNTKNQQASEAHTKKYRGCPGTCGLCRKHCLEARGVV